MTKVRIKRCIDHVENDAINFIDQFIYSWDPVVVHLQFDMDGVENIFNGTITRPVRCTKHNTMTRILNQVKYERMFASAHLCLQTSPFFNPYSPTWTQPHRYLSYLPCLEQPPHLGMVLPSDHCVCSDWLAGMPCLMRRMQPSSKSQYVPLHGGFERENKVYLPGSYYGHRHGLHQCRPWDRPTEIEQD